MGADIINPEHFTLISTHIHLLDIDITVLGLVAQDLLPMAIELAEQLKNESEFERVSSAEVEGSNVLQPSAFH